MYFRKIVLAALRIDIRDKTTGKKTSRNRWKDDGLAQDSDREGGTKDTVGEASWKPENVESKNH